MISELPQDAQELISYGWPDYLDAEAVRHSDTTYTVTLLDLDYKHYTFVLNLSLDERWTVCPIAGFEYGGDATLYSGGVGWLSQERQEQTPDR